MSSSSTETIVDVAMPQMGVSVAEGTVVEWKKQPGDWVEADEIIASISTDKIDTDVESPAWKAPTSGGSTGRPKLIVSGDASVLDLDAPPALLITPEGCMVMPGPPSLRQGR